ncbi:g-patch domain protein, partial [Cooperia oncophora]
LTIPSEDLSQEKTLLEESQSLRDEPPATDPTDRILQTDFGPDNDAGPDDDEDQCEEWERHEALHDDVTEQDRIKPRKYEEEMEIIWEKGGPGLVWYTDKNYWDEREKGTDCDWAWADDWDVDYSVYYEGKSAGSKDAQKKKKKRLFEIREDEAKRSGKLEESVFTKKAKSFNSLRKRRNSDTEVDIERYNKGIGSKLLGRMGWKPGSGLGRSQQGRVDPVAIHLEEDGQTDREKKGFGYHGEKMRRTGFMKVPKVHAIASSFDAVTDKRTVPYKRVGNDDAGEILFRRDELTRMKYRPDAGEPKRKQ